MKKTFFFSFFFLNFHSYAQLKSIQRDSGFIIIEDPAEYIGGTSAMFKFIGKNLQYPKSSKEKGIEGTIYVGFDVNEFGELEYIKVKGSKLTQRTYDKDVKKWIYTQVTEDEQLNKETIRVVSLMPRWKPGSAGGKLVRVAFTLPIKYKLD